MSKDMRDEYIRSLENELGLIKGSKKYKTMTIIAKTLKDPKKAVHKAAQTIRNNPRRSFIHIRQKLRNTGNIDSAENVLHNNYSQWRSWTELDEDELQYQRKQSEKFKKKPVISIITPVFKPPLDVLEELIRSVQNQTYHNYELCLGEVAQDKKTKEFIKQQAKDDPRIKYYFAKENKGIAKDSMATLSVATGDYIALLDHDDLISPDALYENVKLLNEDDYDFIYSDKDKITEAGERYEPMVKPDWSPEIMYNANYLTHLNVFKKATLESIGGWSSDTDGAQDWDLFLRLIDNSKKIGHIPKVLYHWRVLSTSTATSIKAKPYAMKGQKNAVEKHAKKQGVNLTVKHDINGVMSVVLKSKKHRIFKVSVLLVGDYTKRNLSKLNAHLDKSTNIDNVEMRIITDDSGLKLADSIKELARKADAVLVVRTPINIYDVCIDYSQLLNWLDLKDIGSVSPLIVSKDGSVVDSGRIAGYRSAYGPLYSIGAYTPHVFGFVEWIRNVSAPQPYVSIFKANTVNKLVIDKNLITDQSNTYDTHWIFSEKIRQLKYRHVVTPYSRIEVNTNEPVFEPIPSQQVRDLVVQYYPQGDLEYFNVNLALDKPGPMLLSEAETKEERKKKLLNNITQQVVLSTGAQKNIDTPSREPLKDTIREALVLSSAHSYSSEEINKNNEVVSNNTKLKIIDTAVWFLPNFETMYAGLKNIFAYANLLTVSEGTKHIFVFNSEAPVYKEKKLITNLFSSLKKSKFISLTEKNFELLPQSDLSVCTLWTTAYTLLKYNNTKRKLYFIQDWEPDFYPAGSTNALAKQTYGFGFHGICGTEALAKDYRLFKKGNTASTVPSLLDVNHYLSRKKEHTVSSETPYRVMFYSRPDSPRNGFELGLNALTELKKKMGDSVRIVLAGSAFNPDSYDLDSRGIEYAGKVKYSDLGTFYSSFDACLFLMFSGHPGVIPIEMMASGVPVVINDHDNDEWDRIYKDRLTCLRSDPVTYLIAEKIEFLLENKSLRVSIINNGYKLARNYTENSHKKSFQESIKFIKKGQL